MAKKRQSKYYAEYTKERRRIQSAMRSMTKRGYEFIKDILPKIPKKITAGSVRRLKKITTKGLYDQTEHIDYETGEVLTGRQYRQKERKAASEKAVSTRNFRQYEKRRKEEEREQRDYYEQWSDSHDWDAEPVEEPEEDDYRLDWVQAYEWLKAELEDISARYPASKQALDYIVDTAYQHLADYYRGVTDSIRKNRAEFGSSPVVFDIDRLVRKAIGQNIVNSSDEVREAIQAIDESAYNVQGKRFHEACGTLTRILLNRPMTMAENQALTEAMEQDTDFATYD